MLVAVSICMMSLFFLFFLPVDGLFCFFLCGLVAVLILTILFLSLFLDK